MKGKTILKTGVKSRRMKYGTLKENLVGYAFISPWLIGFIAFTVIPMIVSLWFSFTDYDLFTTPVFVGMKNYINLFKDSKFLTSFKVTFVYAFLTVPGRLAISLLVAFMLNKRHKGISIYKTIFYIPTLVGGSIAISIMWKQLFGHGGALMSFMNSIGLPQKNSILGNPNTALSALILLSLWQYGSSMLTFMAGLKNIPASYYEAAAIDGAGSWKKFRHITLPLLTPVIYFNLIMQLIAGFTTFTQALVITQGGPMDRTLLFAVYMYQNAFEYHDMGYASAMSWIMLLVIAVLTYIVVKTSDKWVFYEAGGDR